MFSITFLINSEKKSYVVSTYFYINPEENSEIAKQSWIFSHVFSPLNLHLFNR